MIDDKIMVAWMVAKTMYIFNTHGLPFLSTKFTVMPCCLLFYHWEFTE